MRTMAAVLREMGSPLTVEELELAPPGPGEVLVRVAAAGVCHSDVHLADGHLGHERQPIVLGHEGAGTVEAVGATIVTGWFSTDPSRRRPRILLVSVWIFSSSPPPM